MKKIILIMCLFLICGAAFAQSVFKDVPAGHWAYKDVARLCELGVITGYPDGAFDGTNTLTRYEFAAAVAKVLPLIKDDETLTLATMYDLEKLLPKAEAADGPRDETDLSAYLTADALAAVRRLCDEFEIELLEFNYNQNDFRDGLEALSKRLEAAKKEQEKITLKGHAVFYADGIFSGDSQIMDADDYPVSNSQRKQSFFKDVQLDLDAKINDNLTLVTTTLLGDYLAKTAMDEEVYDTLSDVTPYYFYLSQQEPWGNVRVGRQPFQINQYIFNHEDPNMFIEIPRLWDADFASEGITWKGELGAFDGRAWLLRPVYDWDDPVLEGRYYVPFRIRSKITAMGGGELGYTFPGGIRLSALYTDLLGERKDKEDLLPYGKTRYTPFSDNTKYYGGSLKIPIGKELQLIGTWYRQDQNGDLTYYRVKKPEIMDIKLLYKNKIFTLDGGYKDVDPYYAGIAYNIGSDNSKGWYLKLKYTGLKKFAFDIKLEQYRVKYPGVYSNYNDIYLWSDEFKTATSSLDGSHKYRLKGEYELTPIDRLFAEYYTDYKYDGKKVADDYTLGWRRKVAEGVEFILKYRYSHRYDFGSKARAHLFALQVGIDF